MPIVLLCFVTIVSFINRVFPYCFNACSPYIHKRYSTSRKVDEVTLQGFKIISSDDDHTIHTQTSNDETEIILSDTSSGWGNGKHPTTQLCLKFIRDNVKEDVSFLDYGTGSGILSIMASKLGASRVLAVDVDYECIRAAEHNMIINGVQDKVQVVHTREIYVGDTRFQPSDVTVANILPGPLSRLVGPLWYLTRPGGRLCLSGMRPDQLEAIRRIYEPFVDMSTGVVETASHEIWGEWVSWSVQTKALGPEARREIYRKLTEDSMMDTEE